MDAQRLYDVVVIGGGPAGLTAALYLARARYRVLVVEKETFGGQITITDEIVNYPGVEKTSGRELTETMRRQAENFGAEFTLAEVTGLELTGDVKTVRTDRGSFSCFGVLLATGAHPRMLGFPGEAEFRGRGVAYCATCDGEFFTGKEVFVVGGGFAAAEESVFLTRYAKHVTVLVRKDDFSCAEATSQPTKEHPKITVLYNTEVVEAAGDNALRSLRYRNNKTGEETLFTPEEDTFGLFVFAGYEPETALVKGLVELDKQGYVLTDRNQKTNLDGIYAAGDVCVKNLRQVVTAVGDGAAAATELEKHAAAMQGKTGLHPRKPENSPATAPKERTAESGLFPPEVIAQLTTVFERMQKPLILKLYLDGRPLSDELRAYMEELSKHTDKLAVTTANEAETNASADLPFVRVLRGDGTDSGLAFHGVPGGHEFTSFILGLYNVSGPGQPLDDALAERVRSISEPMNLQILVSLTCTMCPELVTAAQKLAAINELVRAEVYDVNHYPVLRERYKVMSVPCMVINGERVHFGKKNLSQLLDLLAEAGS
ncbi:MAG: FAD-dependent oxidoreductase [Oscillospiraceae bacterium]|nr:FAD-dependent oxidoreductase [Oscillospiraceae bacterium]